LIASLRATILQAVDSPAYYNLTTTYCTTQFNPSTPDDPDVKYFSIAARATRITPLLPLWYTQIVLDETAKGGNAEPDGHAGEKYEGNDGMVSVSSTKHGECESSCSVLVTTRLASGIRADSHFVSFALDRILGLGTVDDCNHWELRARSTFFQRHFSFHPPWSLTSSLLPSFSFSLPRRRLPLPLLPSPSLPSTSLPLPYTHSTIHSISTGRTSQGGEGKLKPSPTPPSSTETCSSSSTEAPPSSSSSSWAWPDINGYLPSYEDISKKLFTPSTTTSGAEGGNGKSVEDGEKQLKSQSWAVMSLLGKLVPSFGGGAAGSGGKAGSSGDHREEVDASARKKKEGAEEKFELARFYRAVILK